MFSLTDVFTVAEKHRWSRYYFFLHRYARCTARTKSNRKMRSPGAADVGMYRVLILRQVPVHDRFNPRICTFHFFPRLGWRSIDHRLAARCVRYRFFAMRERWGSSRFRYPSAWTTTSVRVERDVTSPDVTFRKLLEDVRSTLNGATVPPAVFKYPCIFCNDEFSLVPFVRGAGRSRRSLVHFIANRFL